MHTLLIGGATRSLVYDLNALCRLKKEHGINLLRPEDQDTDDPLVLRALIWAGFLRDEPGLAVETVGGWITLGNMAEVSTAFLRAMQDAMEPMSEAGRANTDPPAGAESSGMTSSASAMVSVG